MPAGNSYPRVLVGRYTYTQSDNIASNFQGVKLLEAGPRSVKQ